MLELTDSTRTRRYLDPDESGAALLAVLVVMLVGFVILSSIAASVVFTVQANGGNKQRTQAFIAAESGRDQMLAQYITSCATSIPDSTTAAPFYKNVTVISSGPDSAHQTSPAGCVSTTQSTVFVMRSTGVGSNGATDTITSTYRRQVTYTNQPGGTTSALYGTFTNTKLSYTGDFVVRGGDYNCTQGGTIVAGNLWVLKDPSSGVGGNASLGSGCSVQGSIYAQGSVQIKGSGQAVGANVISVGSTATVAVSSGTIGGGIYADGGISFPASGGSATSFLAGGAVSGANTTNVTNYASSTGNCAPTPGANCVVNGTLTSTPGTAMFIPSPSTVWNMTTWVDLDATSNWGTGVQWHRPTGSCSTDWTSALTETLASGNTRVGVDLSNCTVPTKGPNSGQLPITLTPSSTQTNDVVFITPASVPMSVTVTASLNPLLSTANSATWPQLYFIHSDYTMGNSLPDCAPGGLANDSVALPTTAQSRVMVYTACALTSSSLNGNGKYSMYGQYYSNAADGKNTAQPEVDCQLMAWTPILNLGCQIAPTGGAVGAGGGTSVPQPPQLVSQTEQ